MTEEGANLRFLAVRYSNTFWKLVIIQLTTCDGTTDHDVISITRYYSSVHTPVSILRFHGYLGSLHRY